MVTYHETTLTHVKHLAANLRKLDREELAATVNQDEEELIRQSVVKSIRCATVFVGGELACIVGVTATNLVGGIGCPWLLATDAATRNKRVFFTECVRVMPELCKGFDKLENYVHVNNRLSIRFLRHVGFTIHDPEPYGCKKELFHKFTMECAR